MRRALLAQHHGIELEQDVGPGESGGYDPGRDRPDIPEMPAEHRIDRRAPGTVAAIDRQFADILRRCSGLARNRCEVGHREIGLRGGVGGGAACRLEAGMIEARAGLAAHEELLVGGEHHRAGPGKALTVPIVEGVGPRVPRRAAGDRRLGVDLHDHLRQRQPGDDEPGADRAHVRQAPRDDRVDLAAVLTIDHAGRQLGEAGERSAGIGQGLFEPVERRSALRPDRWLQPAVALLCALEHLLPAADRSRDRRGDAGQQGRAQKMLYSLPAAAEQSDQLCTPDAVSLCHRADTFLESSSCSISVCA